MPDDPIPAWFARRWLQCGLRPRYAAIHDSAPGDDRRELRPRRDHWELYVVLAGSVTVRWFDRDRVAETDHAYLIAPGSSWQDDLGARQSDWRLFNCGFDLVEAAWPNPLDDLAPPRVFPLGEHREVVARCEEVAKVYRVEGTTLADRVAQRGTLDAFLVAAFAAGFAAGAFPVAAGAGPAWLQAAYDHLLTHLADPEVDVERLARVCGCSTSHLIHSFTRYHRMPPMAYLRHERLALAARLLRGHREVAVRDIARRCGYRDQNLFARHFRRRFGTTPTGWRRGSYGDGR